SGSGSGSGRSHPGTSRSLTRGGDGRMLKRVEVLVTRQDKGRNMTLRKRSTLLVLAVLSATAVRGDHPMPRAKVVLILHGGAGVVPRRALTAEQEGRYRHDLEQALRAGHAVLARGGPSLDAVEAAIKVLEDSPRFNAGKGAVFTHEGRNELDASIMEGGGKRAGAVAGLTRIKNPIAAARAVLERSPHVLLIGFGSDRFD